MRIVYVNDANDMIPLGRVGENAAVQVQFNVAGWAATYGTGVFELMVLNPHDYNPYIVSVTGSDENNVTWTVTDVSTAYSGIGQVQLNYYVDSTVVKSAIWKTQILPSITAEGPTDPPDPYESWIDTLAELGAETERNAGIAVGAARDAGAFAGAAETSAQNAETSAAQAGRSADAAAASAVEASGYESNASGYAQTAGTSAETASGYATLAESYAHGDTGARSGEATDNAQYYSDRASEVVTVLITETLPNAIAAVQDEGATQVGYISSEGADQIAAVAAEGTAQVGNVDDAGTAQVAAVEDEGTRQIGLIQDEGLTQQGAVQDEGTTQKGLVAAEGDIQIGAVQGEGATQIGLVRAEGVTQIGLVGDEGTRQIGLVGAEGTAQIGAVDDEAAAQIGRVASQGSYQVNAVEDAGSAVVATVQSHANDAAASKVAAEAAASAAFAYQAAAATSATQAAHLLGAPLVASTSSAMTDISRVYVYTGSQSGYVSGNWYYYNGSSWVSGGVYNSSAFETDTTLTVSEAAADAKTTGLYVDTLTNASPIDWKTTSGNLSSYPLGWRTGYWNSSGTRTNSPHYICYWTYLSKDNPFTGADLYEIIPPTGYSVYVRALSGEDHTTQEWFQTFTQRSAFKTEPGIYYRIYVGYLDDSSEYLTEAFLKQIVVRPIVATSHKKPNQRDYYQHFTVSVDLSWPDPSNTTTDDSEVPSMTDILCVLRLPNTYRTTGKATPLIMFGHGASCQVTETTWYGKDTTVDNTDANTYFIKLIQSFVDAGFAVFDVNNTRNLSSGFCDWGSLPLMTAYIKAWEYIKTNYNVEERLFLFSDSMGTTVNLNMMKWYGGRIAASVMTAPRPIGPGYRYSGAQTVASRQQLLCAYGIATDVVLNATDYSSSASYTVGDYCLYNDNVYRCTTAITGGEAWNSAHWYQFSADDFYADKFKGFGQYEEIIEINGTKYVGHQFPPCKVMVGKDDTSMLTETRAYYAALKNAGNYVNYREVTGADHTNMSFLGPGSMQEEAVNWLSRFK